VFKGERGRSAPLSCRAALANGPPLGVGAALVRLALPPLYLAATAEDHSVPSNKPPSFPSCDSSHKQIFQDWSFTRHRIGLISLTAPILKGTKIMPHILVRHKVSDFSKWKSAYDSHAPARKEGGLKEEHLLRNMDDPNEVILFFEITDLKKAKQFTASANLRDAMQDAGVVDKPDIYFLE
jgi:hypothetical protein